LVSTQRAYEVYISERTYGKALLIRAINTDLLHYIQNNSLLMLKEDQEDFGRLMAHLQGWLGQFDQSVLEDNPGENSVFAFSRAPGNISYPAAFVKDLLRKHLPDDASSR
jgi:hypothetical protein